MRFCFRYLSPELRLSNTLFFWRILLIELLYGSRSFWLNLASCSLFLCKNCLERQFLVSYFSLLKIYRQFHGKILIFQLCYHFHRIKCLKILFSFVTLCYAYIRTTYLCNQISFQKYLTVVIFDYLGSCCVYLLKCQVLHIFWCQDLPKKNQYLWLSLHDLSH